MTTRSALLFHPIERLLEKLQISGVAGLFTAALNPFLFQGVFGWTIGFVEHTEDTREGKLREFVGGELVGDVVAEFVLWTVVPFLFLDQLEAAAFARVGRIEDVG